MLMLLTSDWHGGRKTYNQSRSRDHDAVYAEIIDIAKTASPDVIINAGDIIDHSKVGHTEIERAVNTLAELAAIAPTVALCGNHDSPALLRTFRTLTGSQQLHFVTAPLGPARSYLAVPGRDGTRMRIGALPFVPAHRGIDAFDDPSTWAGTYRQRVASFQAAVAEGLHQGLDPRREVTVFAAHLHLTGAGLSGSERAGHVNDDYATDPATIPAVDYAVFGHIHQPQPLPGKVPGRYAGSPIQLDFGEAGQQKSIALINLEPGRPATHELVPLHGGRQMIQFRGTLAELEQQADDIGDALCLLTIHTDTYDPALAQRVQDLLSKATIAQVSQLAADAKLSSIVVEPGTSATPSSLLDAFDQYLRTHGSPTAPAAVVSTVMAELLAADNEDREPIFAVESLLAAHTCTGTPA